MTKRRSVSHSRLLKTLDRHPALPELLKNTAPRAVATLLQRTGIADATELMTMVPAQTLVRVFDEALWSDAPERSLRLLGRLSRTLHPPELQRARPSSPSKLRIGP